jgi:hypothetical protein
VLQIALGSACSNALLVVTFSSQRFAQLGKHVCSLAAILLPYKVAFLLDCDRRGDVLCFWLPQLAQHVPDWCVPCAAQQWCCSTGSSTTALCTWQTAHMHSCSGCTLKATISFRGGTVSLASRCMDVALQMPDQAPRFLLSYLHMPVHALHVQRCVAYHQQLATPRPIGNGSAEHVVMKQHASLLQTTAWFSSCGCNHLKQPRSPSIRDGFWVMIM